jgi:hypothetical protein
VQGCSREEFLSELKKIETWTYGKCELYHWIDILDLCDDILEAGLEKTRFFLKKPIPVVCFVFFWFFSGFFVFFIYLPRRECF